jgi:hypothetical protein
VQVVRRDARKQVSQNNFARSNRFYDDLATLLEDFNCLIQIKVSGLHDTARNSNSCAIAPFLNNRTHKAFPTKSMLTGYGKIVAVSTMYIQTMQSVLRFPRATSRQTHGDIVRQFIEQVINTGEIDAIEQFFWEEMVELAPFPARVQELKD